MNDPASADQSDHGSSRASGAASSEAGDGGGRGAQQGTAAAMPWVISTNFSEGLPWSLVHQVSAEIFTALGASLQAIGNTSLYGFMWNGKVLWSPLVDIYSTTRRWIIALELALVLAIGFIAWPAGQLDLASVAIGFTLVAFLGATQDIAIDGFYLRVLAKEQQASLSGLRIGAFRVAMLVGKGLLVLLAGLTSWRVCFLAASGIMLALTVLHAALLPREERRPASVARPSYVGAFTTFFSQPKVGWSLSFILFYRAGDALMFAMSPPLLKSLGLDTAMRAVVSGIFGTIVSIAGSILGGVIIGRYGFARTLRPIASLQSAAILLYVWLAWAKPGLYAIAAMVLIEQLVAGVGTAALAVFLMRRSTGKYKASHFAIGSSFMSLGATLLGTASGHIAHAVGFPVFFTIAFAASIPGVLLSFKVPTE